MSRYVDEHGFPIDDFAETEPPKDPNDFCGVLCDFAEDIINRQKAEIERLREIRDLCNATILEKNEQIEKLKISDASKEECTIKQHGEIKELKAEIERLKSPFIKMYEQFEGEIKAEAIKEFAERLKREKRDLFNIENIDGLIDNLIKEMVGDV